MRIAILVGGLPPLYNGGTEIATVKIAEYAAKEGHEVHIVAADGNNGQKHYKELEKYGFRVHRIQTIPPHYIHGLTYIPSAVKELLKIKPDLIHAQALYMSPSAYIVNKLKGIPYLIYERGGIYLRYFLAKPARRVFYNKAQRIIAQTQHQKNEILKYVKRDDIEVIPNGIDIERFGRLSKQEARNKLGLPQDKRIVISVGRCRPEKNLEQFIKVANMGINEVLFLLVGDGEQLNELMKFADKNVWFADAVNNNDIPIYLSASDILVNTSLSEGFPVAILEGMASGLPIVCPRICGLPEIVTDYENGLLTCPQNIMSTYEQILRILDDKELYDKMSQNNKEKAKQYTWQNVVRRLYG